VVVVASWVWALTLALFTSKPAQASEGVEEGGAFRGAFASNSATMLATFELAQSREEPPLSEPPPEARREPTPPPSWLVGYCDVRGATAVAPLPALPVRGGEIAADDSSCHESTLQGGATVEHEKNPGPPPPLEGADAAALPVEFRLSVWESLRQLPGFDERHQALPRGFARGIEEPPRG
jgi:hypothetical protein